jgi:ATP-dependent protease ClpP protease subunit
MPSWGQVLKELQDIQIQKNQSALDVVRRKYLAALAQQRGRNVIAYYSGWLQKPGLIQTSINDEDTNAFMAVIHGLDRSKGLDLLLHTPGGDMAATEALINYLHQMFNGDIEAFIPQIAMSAGTMIACSCKKIHMGKQSSIGPIDPQLGGGYAAYGVIKEFDDALEAIKKDPTYRILWQMIIGRYPPTFLGECKNAIVLANEIVLKRLETVMFDGDAQAHEKAEKIVNSLNEHNLENKTHNRHIGMERAAQIGLKIERLETNQTLQDAILTVHHCFMHTFANAGCIKITENSQGSAVINNIPTPKIVQKI